ncbi:MAG TPA: cation:proton antiporter, partial [Bacteroidetes bacterium]|nr:cation:proton antiporter [Bacteroidota bacterium]
GITVRVLTDLDALNTLPGTTIISAAVIDDIIGIIVLGVSLGTGNIYLTSIGVVAFFIFILSFYTFIIEKLSTIIERVFQSPYSYVALGIVFVLLFSVLAKILGLAAITGAYFAGIIIGKTKEKRIILENIRGMGYALFIPLFFVGIGFKLVQEISTLESESHILLLQMLQSPIPYIFVILAIIGKVLGSVLGSKFLGLDLKDSLIVGFGMVPRMEVALTVATLAISILDFTTIDATQIIYSTILLVLISSLMTPPIIQAFFKK